MHPGFVRSCLKFTDGQRKNTNMCWHWTPSIQSYCCWDKSWIQVWCDTCWSSSDLLQQVSGEEAKLPPCADLQVAVYLLTLLHHDLSTHTQNKHTLTWVCHIIIWNMFSCSLVSVFNGSLSRTNLLVSNKCEQKKCTFNLFDHLYSETACLPLTDSDCNYKYNIKHISTEVTFFVKE